ncbi:MAG TPA: universal stress protein, partial [Chitinophagales bacterium]|nr:universal stress protein [Chitinophagales bacterium]
MKHLMVPIDFSEYAYNACQFALQLASQYKAKVTVFHAYHIPIVDPLMPSEYLSDIAESAEKEINSNMEKLLNQMNEYVISHHLGSIDIKSYVTMGFAVDEIILAAQKLEPDLIVMGRRYTEGMTKILLGSITSTIVEKAKLPVLVVPENVKAEKPVTDVLYASEFDEADKRTLAKVLSFAQPLNARVHCVHVDLFGHGEESSKAKLEELEKVYTAEKNKGQIIFRNITSENTVDGLLGYVDSNHISIMAMLTHKRPFFTKLFD